MRPLTAAILLLALVFAAGCEKPNDGLGDGVLPDGVLLGVGRIDTLQLRSTSLLDDSVRADGQDAVLLGAMNDPEFGATRTGFYTQVRLSTTLEVIDIDNVVIDSVVLAIAYNGGQYGFDFPQNYEVYELDEMLYPDSLYFTNRELALKEGDLVLPESRTQRPAPETAVTVLNPSGPEELAPQLRLRLKAEVGEAILAASGTESTSNADAFTEFFKGLYVTVAEESIPTNNGGIHYFNLLDPESKVTIYFKEGMGAQERIDLLINSNAVYFSRPLHDYSTANPSLQMQLEEEPGLGNENLFLQAAAGLKVQLDFPSLLDLQSDTIAINNVELVIPYETADLYAPPARLFAIGRDNDGTAFLLPDFIQGDAHFDGFIDVQNQEYRIRLSRWTQQVLSGERDPSSIELVTERAATSANRTIIHGPSHPDRPMELIIQYTKY